MQILGIIGKIVDALATAVGVFLGLTPDPTRIPVEHDDQRRAS